MSDIVIYLGKVVIIQAVLYAFYRFTLKQTSRHSWNRYFLLLAIFLSFTIPFVKTPTTLEIEVIDTEYATSWVEESAIEYKLVPNDMEDAKAFPFWLLISGSYVMIAIFLIGRSVLYLFFLQKLKKKSEYVKKHWFKLFKTTQIRPFSFFSNVFIPGHLFGSESFDQILAHECVHVKQRHSFDRLFMDFIVSLFWFNPFIYLYRNALVEIHEYQADEAVIKKFNDPIGYQEILFSQLQTSSYSGLVSHFNFSMIKKRIVMINKQKNRYSGWVYLLVLPVIMSVIFAFSNKKVISPIETAGNKVASLFGPQPILETFSSWNIPSENKNKYQQEKSTNTLVQDRYTPSILPLKNTENVRMTSGFGMRMHPIEKVEKMHKGMDLATPIGNPVLATADGIIHNADQKDKYGKFILIDHGDEFMTRYSQLSSMSVKRGDKVKRGDVIGMSGNSGASTAPHLHYEVVKVGEGYMDPADYIKNYSFKASLKKIEPNKKANQQPVEQIENGGAEKELALAKQEAELSKMDAKKARKSAKEAEKRAYQEMKKAEEQILQIKKLEKVKTKVKKKDG